MVTVSVVEKIIQEWVVIMCFYEICCVVSMHLDTYHVQCGDQNKWYTHHINHASFIVLRIFKIFPINCCDRKWIVTTAFTFLHLNPTFCFWHNWKCFWAVIPGSIYMFYYIYPRNPSLSVWCYCLTCIALCVQAKEWQRILAGVGNSCFSHFQSLTFQNCRNKEHYSTKSKCRISRQTTLRLVVSSIT